MGWDQAHREYAFWAQFAFMFGFTKVVKLVGLFVRNPSDLMLLPVSIAFGYFHGLIKLWALVTLNVVCIYCSLMIPALRKFTDIMTTDDLGQSRGWR